MNTKEALIAINLLPQLGPIRLRRLLEVFGTPQRVLSAKAFELQRVRGIGEQVVGTLLKWEEQVDLQGELRRIQELGAQVIVEEDEDYPSLLREIYDPPIVLYALGKLEARDRNAIGIVGSRRTTIYGCETARKFAYQLASSGLTIVSGLARGIDTEAHQAALAAKGRTIAVVGSGLGNIYPEENHALAERIATSGAVLSEFPIQTRPDKRTFPMRNRIISGMSQSLLVVEAGLKSGALITANQATEQNRTVYAVPGPIDRESSAGCNRLIQEGAKLVVNAADILDDMSYLIQISGLPQSKPEKSLKKTSASQACRSIELSEKEQKIYDALDGGELFIDEITQKTQLPSGAVSSTLLTLEMKSIVKQLPGKHFRRV